MPNWVDNELIISGENVNEFIQFNQDDENQLSFEKSVPCPDTVYKGCLGSIERKSYGKNNWYDWNIENWGTKWDCNNSTIVTSDQHMVHYDFTTAWSPPLAWLEKTKLIKYLCLKIKGINVFFKFSNQ